MQPLQTDESKIANFLPGTKGMWNGKLYSIGLWDAAVALVTRQSTLDELGLCTPTLDQPWTTVQQVGTPLELYHRPANRFVAGFIGPARQPLTLPVAGNSPHPCDHLTLGFAPARPTSLPATAPAWAPEAGHADHTLALVAQINQKLTPVGP